MLRALQVLTLPIVKRGGIGHGRVEPQPVEIVAQIVMRVNVAPAALQAVTAEKIRAGGQRRAHSVPGEQPAQPVPVLQRRGRQRGEVVRLPFAVAVILGKGDIAPLHQIGDDAPILERDLPPLPGVPAFKGAGDAVRGRNAELPVFQPVQRFEKSIRSNFRQHGFNVLSLKIFTDTCPSCNYASDGPPVPLSRAAYCPGLDIYFMRFKTSLAA